MLLGSAARRPCRGRKQKNCAVGHHSVDVKNYQLDLPGALFGHGDILTAEIDSLIRARLLRGFGGCYNTSYNALFTVLDGEQLAKVGKAARMSSMVLGDIPVALAWAHPLGADGLLGKF